MTPQTFGALGSIYDGPHATPTRRETGPYFLNISSLSSGRLDLSRSDHVDESDFRAWTRRVRPQENDLLFSYETRLGEAALMPGNVRACLGRRMALLRPNLTVIDPHFLLYYYLSPAFKQVIASRSIHGATVSRIPLNRMADWPVDIPGLPSQMAIAAVLGALDDKIATNAALASTSRRLSDALFQAAATGEEQQGPLNHLGSFIKGVSYRREDLAPSATAMVTLKSVTREGTYAAVGLKPFTGAYRAEQEISLGDVVIAQTDLTQGADVIGRAVRVSSSGNFGKLVASLDLVIARPREGVAPEYLLGALRQERFREHCRSHSSGTTVLHLQRGTFDSYLAPLLSDTAQHKYVHQARPLYALADSADREVELLVKLRDTLLPALMSGRLRVKDAERQVEDAV